MLHHVPVSTIMLDELVASTVLPSQHNLFCQSPKLIGVTLQHALVFAIVRALDLTGQYFFVILILQRLLV
jgi:hypothetical protein